MSEITISNLAQKRAADALTKIKSLENQDYGNYNSYVNALPATVIMNGLGQAAAMLVSSAKLKSGERKADHRAYESLYNHLSTWLCRNEQEAPYGAGDLLTMITTPSEDAEKSYIKAQTEAMAYLEWLKKFSNAYLKKD